MIVVYRLKQLVVGDCGSYDDMYQASILDSDFLLLCLVRFEILWNFVRPASRDEIITIWNPFMESIYRIDVWNPSTVFSGCLLNQYISGVVMIAII